MQKRHLILLLLFLACGGLPALAQQVINTDTMSIPEYFIHLYQRERVEENRNRTVIRQVNVLNSNPKGTWKRFRTVIVKGDRIHKIRSSIFPTQLVGAQVINGRHQYLVPGFIDMHVHRPCYAERNDLLHLMNGITALREMDGYISLWYQENMIRTNVLLWPDYFVTNPFPTSSRGESVNKDGRAAKTNFFDFQLVKALEIGEGPYSMPIGVDEHLPIALEIGAGNNLQEYLKLGNIRTIERLDGLMSTTGTQPSATQADYDTIVDRGIYLVPCVSSLPLDFLTFARRVSTGPERSYIAADERQRWTQFYANPAGIRDSLYAQIVSQRSQKCWIVQEILKRGGKVLIGSEAGANVPLSVAGFTYHREMENLQTLGMTPRQVLDAATQDAAAALYQSQEIGSLQRGLRADMVLLAQNPLLDIAATRAMQGLCLRGNWFDAKELQELSDAATIK